MRRILVCTGILGGGTALVFALAAATALLFPQGALVSSGFNGNMRIEKTMPGFGPVMLNDVVTLPAEEAPAVAVPEPAP